MAIRWDYIPGKTPQATPKSIKRSQTSRQNKINGGLFEDLISGSLKWYESRGLLCVEKTPEPMRPLSKPDKQGRFLACFTKAAQPDFKGTIFGGRSIVFEAKHTEGDRINYSVVSPEQIDRLEMHYKMGAVAFVLVSFKLQDFYRIPWSVWRDMKAIHGFKHIKQKDCEPYKIPFYAGVIKLLDDIEEVTK